MNKLDLVSIFALVACLCGMAFGIYLSIHADGWRQLAKHYRTDQPAWGRKWVLQNATIGFKRVGPALILTTNAEGIFMEIFAPFRFRRPRLFIPWQDFHNAKIKDYILWRDFSANIGKPTIETVHLNPYLIEHSEGRKTLEQPPIGTNVPAP